MSQETDLVELRKRIRHSAAHVMADVVTQMFPEAKLGIGPPTDEGFYYDFMVEEAFSEQDLSRIEKRMRRVVQQNHAFEYHEYPRDEAERMNAAEPLKMEIIEEIPRGREDHDIQAR